MLETLMKLYVMAMAYDVRSPMPHLFGPPGCGKSTVARDLAALVGVNLHIINLARISPLDLEGVQMPHGSGDDMKLRLLHATFWTQIQAGDVVLFDEALRAYPEVFNGLLDILTSREVGGLKIPPAFFIAASNSIATYDSALEDRLLHLPVADPRKSKAERNRMAQLLVDALGLHPSMVRSDEMDELLSQEVLPLFSVLDDLQNKSSSGNRPKGKSLRNLIGQAQLRHIQSSDLKTLLNWNNTAAANKGAWQYVLLYDPKHVHSNYERNAQQLLAQASSKLTPVQLKNTQLNLQMLQLAAAKSTTTERNEDGPDDDPPF